MSHETLGYAAAAENLARANEKAERRRREEEAQKRMEAQRDALRKKQQPSDGLSFRLSMLLFGAGGGNIRWPHEGSGSWESDWRPIDEREEGTLMAQLRQTWSARQESGYMGGYEYFSYHRKGYTTAVELKLVSGDVEGSPITALLFENSAIDHSFGDVKAFVHPKKPLYGLPEDSPDVRQARDLLTLVEDAFLPPDHAIIQNRD